MAPLVCSPWLPELRATGFMEVPEVLPRSHHLLARRSSFCSWLLGTERLISPYVCRPIRGHVVKFTLSIGTYNSLVESPMMSIGKGKSTTYHRGLCKVIWTIEADLTDGEHLYITGDPNALGCWEPEVAILMSPTEHCSLWKAEVKVACGTNLKYNYFIKGTTKPSSDIIWRPGPGYSLSVPLLSKRDKQIVVRDSWMKFKDQRHLVPLWGSWMEETIFPVQPVVLALAKDEEDKISENLRGDSFEPKQLFDNLPVKDDKAYGNTEGQESNRTLSEENQPVEEPWLLHSSLSFIIPTDNAISEVSKSKRHEPDGVIQLQFHNQHVQDMKRQVPEELDSQISLEDHISTVILINSSICTMQRIAVLEDNKLVELLLEPVKNNVQCDSIYLGVVTKLVPHMGGAFVNIGSSRPSLMDIKHNREPFIFPPFCRRANREEVDGFLFGMQRDHISHDDVDLNDDFAEVDFLDEPVHFVNDDLEEQKIKNELYFPEVIKKNVNGSVINYGGEDADFKDWRDLKEQHMQDDTINDLCSVVTEVFNDSKSLKDPVNTFKVNTWSHVQKGTKTIVQVVKEGLGTKGPTLTAFPKLRSRFWILITRCDRVGVSKKITGAERTRLRVIAKKLQPQGFGLTIRTVAAGHSIEELQNDLEGLLSTWKNVMEHAKSASLAADEGVEGAIPVMLHRAMGQTLSVVQDYFNEKVKRMVVDSPRAYHEVTNYLQEIAPDLCDRVELYNKRIPLFDQFNIGDEINSILNKRVSLANGGSLVIEQTEALVSIDVNGGHGMFGQGNSQEKAVLDVNLAAAKQIARELRLRDIGGIIVVDFIDMTDDSNKRLVYEEVKKAVERDRSLVKVSELSKHGLMEITRKRVRPSVTFMISEPCTCCQSTGRVEAAETSFSKIEHEICRLLAMLDQKADPENPNSWPKIILRVDHYMCNYFTSGRKTRLATLSSSLKVWILLKVARGFNRGTFEVKPFTDDKITCNQHQVPISMLCSAEVGAYNPSKT